MSLTKRRELPHWNPEDAAIFITWRLHGSFPAPDSEWEVLPAGKQFVAEDQALLKATGPHYMKDPRIAAVVASAIKYGAEVLDLYDLYTWVIMSNHVHILIQPHAPLARITKAVKNYSAKQANLILGLTGQPFWQIESFDRWVRNEQEFQKTIHYIENNPVAAGIVALPEHYQWSGKAGREACDTI